MTPGLSLPTSVSPKISCPRFSVVKQEYKPSNVLISHAVIAMGVYFTVESPLLLQRTTVGLACLSTAFRQHKVEPPPEVPPPMVPSPPPKGVTVKLHVMSPFKDPSASISIHSVSAVLNLFLFIL